ncbi:MAG: hypothetical protein PWP52_705 [Bacteroidales bacterium]|nr:hypothetical protein [Bacteroidales bacterium]
MSWLVKEENNIITQGTVLDNIPWELDPAPLGIVLSNPCDLEWGKASYLLVASLVPAKETIQMSKEFKQKVESAKDYVISKTKWKSFEVYLKQFINNQNIARYYFIDPTNAIEAPLLFVDFQHLLTIPIFKKDNLEIVAKLPSPHTEKMISHFSSYISRIGVDRENKEDAEALINQLAAPYHSS